MNSTNLSTNTTPKSTMATQHTPRCQQLGSSSGPALMVMSINIEGMSAAKHSRRFVNGRSVMSYVYKKHTGEKLQYDLESEE